MILKYDLKNGIIQRSVWLLLPIVIFLIALYRISSYAAFYDYGMNLGKCLLIALAGNVSIESAGKHFSVPMLWLVSQLGSVLFTLEYPLRDLNLFGRQIIVRCEKRYQWWLSKCVWCLLSVWIYWLIGIIMMVVFCLIRWFPLSLTIDSETAASVLTEFDTDFTFMASGKAFWLLILVPMTMSALLCMLQMLISLLKNEITALCVSVIFIIWSMCSLNPIAFLNYAMMQRLSLFYHDGMNVFGGFAAALIMIVCCVLAGIDAFNRMDILEVKKNEAN